MAHKIKNDKDNQFTSKASEACLNSVGNTEAEDYLFNGRMIATPIIAANVSLDVKDRLSASEMSEECGGEAIDNKKIAQDVAVNGSLGFLLQGTNIAIYPGGEEVPVSTAAEATRN